MFSFLANTGYTIDDIKNSFMINEGDTASPYEPYGYKDKWYLYKAIDKVILDGSETGWGVNTVNNHKCYDKRISVKSNNTSNSTVVSGLSNLFWASKRDKTGYDINSFSLTNDILIITTEFNYTTTEWRDYLSTHNLIIYFATANPTATEITDTELVSQLNAINDYLTSRMGSKELLLNYSKPSFIY